MHFDCRAYNFLHQGLQPFRQIAFDGQDLSSFIIFVLFGLFVVHKLRLYVNACSTSERNFSRPRATSMPRWTRKAGRLRSGAERGHHADGQLDVLAPGDPRGQQQDQLLGPKTQVR